MSLNTQNIEAMADFSELPRLVLPELKDVKPEIFHGIVGYGPVDIGEIAIEPHTPSEVFGYFPKEGGDMFGSFLKNLATTGRSIKFPAYVFGRTDKGIVYANELSVISGSCESLNHLNMDYLRNYKRLLNLR